MAAEFGQAWPGGWPLVCFGPMNCTDIESRAEAVATDVVVVGAGPAGLFQLFQLGLQGLDCHVLEALPHPGGQCAELYPRKPIYDIGGVPACTGLELAELLLEQLKPFAIQYHWGHTVADLSRGDDGLIEITSEQGLRLRAKAVVLALGVGAFTPRPLKLAGLDALLGRQVFYQSGDRDAPVAGRKVVVLGGDEDAVCKALELACLPAGQGPQSVTLLHRRDAFKAEEDVLAQLAASRAQGSVAVQAGQLQALQVSAAASPTASPTASSTAGTAHAPVGTLANGMVDAAGACVDAATNQQAITLTGLALLDGQGQDLSIPADVLLVYQGISPRLGTLVDWGLAMQQKMLTVNPATLATSMPGVYAIGDIAAYAGKRKLIASAFHEATLAAYAIAEQIAQAPVPLQYTTTSTRFLQRLGKLPPGKAGADMV